VRRALVKGVLVAAAASGHQPRPLCRVTLKGATLLLLLPQVVDPECFKGPIRLRLAAAAGGDGGTASTGGATGGASSAAAAAAVAAGGSTAVAGSKKDSAAGTKGRRTRGSSSSSGAKAKEARV
jgi:hypothetical protein